MDTKPIRDKWTAAADTTNSQEFAVNPAELAAVVAEGVPDGLELPEARTGCTHVVITRAQLQAILSYERPKADSPANVRRQPKPVVDDPPQS